MSAGGHSDRATAGEGEQTNERAVASQTSTRARAARHSDRATASQTHGRVAATRQNDHVTASRQIALGEWRKLASLPSTWLTCAVTLALPALMAGALASSPEYAAGQAGRAVRDVTEFAAIGFIVLGVLAVTGEYTGGQVRRSLLCAPRRGQLALAKLAVVSLLAVGLACATTVACAVAAGLPASQWSLVACGAAHLVAMCLLAAAVALALRSLVASLSGALAVLVVAPPLLAAFEPASWLPSALGLDLVDAALPGAVLPSAAGHAPPVAAAGLAAWVAAAWIAAAVRFARSDA